MTWTSGETIVASRLVDLADKDAANGFAGLNASAKVPDANLEYPVTTQISTHAILINNVHGVGASTIESTSGSQNRVDVHSAQISGIHGIGTNILTFSNIGSYTGDDNVNRAIAHGLGKIPTTVFTFPMNSIYAGIILKNSLSSGYITNLADGTAGPITYMDATNFYVGTNDAGHYGNRASDLYKWVAYS